MNIDVIGINEDALNSLIVELGNYEEQLVDILNGMEDAVSNAMPFFKCDASNIFVDKFNNIKNNFPLIISNLETYQADLIRAKDNNARIDEETCKKFELAIGNIGKVAKKNNGGA